MNIGRIIGAVAFAAVAAVGRGEWRTIDGTGSSVTVPLNLSSVWDKRSLDEEQIAWSSLGWDDEAEAAGGKTVTLQLIPLSAGAAVTLMTEQKGHRQTYVWEPDGVTKQVYRIQHKVIGGSVLETDLKAYFSFERYDNIPPSEVEVRAAIRSADGYGQDFGVANDSANWWILTDGPGDGIEARTGTSSFAFTMSGQGEFLFDYALWGGEWTVTVDGVQVQAPSAAGDWAAFRIPIGGFTCRHTVVFHATLSAGGDIARLRNVRWMAEDSDWRVESEESVETSFDLREGVRVLKDRDDLLPFAYSSTNFTGVAGATSESIVEVSIIRVIGAGEDVSRWTDEVPGTARVLYRGMGESTVAWKGKPGVWRATFIIANASGGALHTETAVFDMRQCVRGLLIRLR